MPIPLSTALLGLLSGVVFGFLLQRGGVTKFPVIVGQFLFRDFTVLKVMLTAIVTGGVGVYALKAMGLVTLHVKPAQMMAVIVGGLIFGAGMVVLGYCPGTGVAAAGEGKRDALMGVIGMMAGAAFFAELYDGIGRTVLAKFDLGTVTLPDVTGIPASVLLGVLLVGAVVLFRAIERFEAKKHAG